MEDHQVFQLHVAQYEQISQDVRLFLRTNNHLAALHNADEMRARVLSLLNNAETHNRVFPPGELQQLRTNARDMLRLIDENEHAVHDASHGAAPAPVTLVPTAGRPRIDIDYDFLKNAHEMAPPGHIAQLLSCSARTVRRRVLEAGLATPAPPVFRLEDPAGGVPPSLVRNPEATGRVSSDISDDDLDGAVAEILQQFQNEGRSIIAGQLRARGHHHVPRDRIRQSIQRVTGVPAHFGRQPIQRREYRVAGPDSLWHHDGQHGLIHWKIVIHAFVDGFSRFVVGIRASNNNRAETVEQLFREIIMRHGAPSRVRGDHGVENLLVARLMEELRGLNRGSYIWGKSVHNVRIERLWVDVVKGFVASWSNFFIALEQHHALDRNDEFHIWLLHHLFLACINFDALAWAEGWNHHSFSRLPNHPPRSHLPSPRELYYFGVYQNGVRAMDIIDEDEIPDLAHYGVDWEEHDDPRIMRIHWQQNQVDIPEADEHENGYGLPRSLVEVRVPAPPIPISDAEVAALDLYLEEHVDMTSSNPDLRRLWWVTALEYFNR